MVKLTGLISGLILGTCLGVPGGNFLVHYSNYRDGLAELRKDHYGPNLRRQWEQYTQEEISMINDFKFLLPFECFFNMNKRPLAIEYVGSEDHPPMPIQFDVVKKRDNSI